jgi:hypothetical protein
MGRFAPIAGHSTACVAIGLTVIAVVGACAVREPPAGTVSRSPSQPPSPRAGALRVDLPELDAGDRWKYRYSGGEQSGTFTEHLSARETLAGVDCWVLSTGERRQALLRASDMAIVEEREEGAVVVRYRPPLELLRWPLYVGSSWKQTLVLDRPKDDASADLVSECRVTGEEMVTVPAGSFDTLKIDCRSNAGVLIERWFSPEVRNAVRVRSPRKGALVIRELVEYQLAR